MKPYSAELALTLFKLFEDSYIDADISLQEHTKSLGFEIVKEFGSATKVGGFICKNTEIAVLVFRGTHNKYEMLVDLKFLHIKQNGINYTDGFWDAYNILYPEFKNFIETNTLTLYIGGHSLGGALALITAMNLSAEKFEACYTAGAPRVCGFSGLKLGAYKNIYRFIHENDIVPSLPLIIMGYWGIGQMVYITSDNEYITGWKAYVYRITAQIIPLSRKGVLDAIVAVENFFIGDKITALSNIATVIKEFVFSVTGFIENHLIKHYIEAGVANLERKPR